MALDIRVLLRVAAQIPAGLHSSMWIERVYAGLWRGRVKDELRLSVLLSDRVVVGHDNRSVWVAIRTDAQPEQAQINYKRDGARSGGKQEQAEKYLPQPFPEFCRGERHSGRL